MVPAKPLPFDRPLTLIRSPGSNDLDRDAVADGQALGVADLDQMAVRALAGLLQVACLGLRDALLLDGAEGELDGRVAVRLGVFTWTTGQGPASTTVTDVTLPDSWSKIWVMPSLVPMMPFSAISRA